MGFYVLTVGLSIQSDFVWAVDYHRSRNIDSTLAKSYFLYWTKDCRHPQLGLLGFIKPKPLCENREHQVGYLCRFAYLRTQKALILDTISIIPFMYTYIGY